MGIQTITNEGEHTLRFPKHPRKVAPNVLRKYREEHPVCELCGSGNRLGSNMGGCHHIRSRAQLGSDTPENLICLCGACHTSVHAGRISKETLLKAKGLL